MPTLSVEANSAWAQNGFIFDTLFLEEKKLLSQFYYSLYFWRNDMQNKSKMSRSILATLLVTGLAGCNTIFHHNKDYSVESLSSAMSETTSTKTSDPTLAAGLETTSGSKSVSTSKFKILKNLLKDEIANDNNFDPTCFDGSATAPHCKSQRNAAIAGLMAISDELCVDHVKTIYGNEAAYNLAFGTAANLFSGAATVASSSSAKTLFSSISLFSGAEKSLINETVYKTMLVTSISKKIREGRKDQRNTLVKRLHKDTIADFSMNEAISSVMEYHNTCSFMYGMEKALEEGHQNGTEMKKLALERQLQRLQLEVQSKGGLKNIKGTADGDGLESRIKALHEAIMALETPMPLTGTPPATK